MGVVVHKSIDELRHRSRSEEYPLDEDVAEVDEKETDSNIESLYKALRKLKSKFSEVLQLRYFAGLSDKEIALTLKISAA